MSQEFKKLYAVAYNLAELAKDEHGSKYIGSTKLIQLLRNEHFAQLLLSRLNSDIEKLKVLALTFLILNRPSLKQESLEKVLNNLYVSIIEWYDDTTEIMKECDRCDGSGDEDCESCDGSGKIDCKYCDGDGKVECYDCDGTGDEECRWCDGKGTETETEEDDEGEEVEVEVPCTSCDGNGTEACRNCSGSGEFECSECLGSGNYDCGDCGGYGQYTCGYCGGSGEQDSGEIKYYIKKVWSVVLGNQLSKYVDEYLSFDDYENIDDDDYLNFSIEFASRWYADDNVTVEDRRESVDMEDDFIYILELVKLESFKELRIVF
jgi:hypothetical protein